MYVFGPVPSRRLGRSLGVSPIPRKTCSYSCVYCQLGRTDALTVERKSFFDKQKIFDEISRCVTDSDCDYITFAGDGEPTLSTDLEWLIEKCRHSFNKPTAVLTNGSFLSDQDVRSGLMKADVVLPSLDAGNEELFKKINRPHKTIKYNGIISGLKSFRETFRGKIWLEIMLVRGINDTHESLTELKQAVAGIAPDRVYIMTPIRPPAESWVKPPPVEHLTYAYNLLNAAAVLNNPEIGAIELSEGADFMKAVLNICRRHPLRLDQARKIAQRYGGDSVLHELIESSQLNIVQYGKHKYVVPPNNNGENNVMSD
ncbi:radical SAM protein [candidate division KSB1 bacterium]